MYTLTEKTLALAIRMCITPVNDVEGMTRLLEPLPRRIAQDVQAVAASRSVFEGMRHDVETRRAFLIRCDGSLLQCWAWDDVSLQETAAMWAIYKKIWDMDPAIAKRAYCQATGRTVGNVH